MSVQKSAKQRRVVQWATGNVGLRALQGVIQHPDLELVGVWVHSKNKIGQDAGVLCGLPPTGVKAVGRVEDVIALKPDCVLYMPHELKLDDLCGLLAAGINVVTTLPILQYPPLMNPELRSRIEDACQKGNSSIHGTGSSPGFATEALPIVLTSIQRRLDKLSIYEYAPCETRNSPEMLFGVMGFGADPSQGPSQAIAAHMKESFGGTLSLIADAVGLKFDAIEVKSNLGIARNDVTIAAGVVPAGTIAATRTAIIGTRQGKPLMQMVATWFVSTDVDTDDGMDWQFRESGWRMVVEGDCPLDVNIRFPVAPENYAAMTPGLTANRPVNAIPFVCDAAPGIRTTFDLPYIIPQFA